MRYAAASPSVLAGIVLLSCPAIAGETRHKPAYYSVVKITSADRSIVHEAVETKKVAARRAELMKEYREAVKAWNAEAGAFRKDKANRGKRFDRPRPAVPSLLTVKQNIRDKAEAEKLVGELEARHSVVKIKGVGGETAYEAVQSMRLGTRKAEIEAEYREALNAWNDEAAAFRKENPGKFYDEPRAARPSLIVVRKDLKDKASAEAVVRELQKKLDKKQTAPAKNEAESRDNGAEPDEGGDQVF